MKLNTTYNEPCLETLRKMPNDFLDCVITSPPYWQLRDYGYEGQWGLEPTYSEYLENLWSMMDEIYRVLKPTGTVWINLGDTYSKSKCLLLIPHRFAIGCIERGWIMRNDIIWAKRNGMPESITDRFTKKHEYFFFMTKSTEYYFDLDGIRDKVKAESLKRYEYAFSGNKGGIDRDMVGYTQGDKSHLIGEKPQYSVLDKDFRNLIVEVRDLPNHDTLREYLNSARKSAGITIKEIEDIFETQAPHHWFERNGSYPSKEDWIKLKDILSFDNTYDDNMTNIELKSGLKQNNPKGKNCGDVADFWDILTKPNSDKHYASYNEELIHKPIISGCPEFGIIYDPFMGTGSTAVASLRRKRSFIGSEMSEDYIKICDMRVNAILQAPTLF